MREFCDFYFEKHICKIRLTNKCSKYFQRFKTTFKQSFYCQVSWDTLYRYLKDQIWLFSLAPPFTSRPSLNITARSYSCTTCTVQTFHFVYCLVLPCIVSTCTVQVSLTASKQAWYLKRTGVYTYSVQTELRITLCVLSRFVLYYVRLLYTRQLALAV